MACIVRTLESCPFLLADAINDPQLCVCIAMLVAAICRELTAESIAQELHQRSSPGSIHMRRARGAAVQNLGIKGDQVVEINIPPGPTCTAISWSLLHIYTVAQGARKNANET